MIGKREGFYSLSVYFSQGIGLILGFITAKLLGPDIYGYYSIGKIVLSYALLFSLGMPNALIKILPNANNPDKVTDTAISFSFIHFIPAVVFSISILKIKNITITYRTFILFSFAILFLMIRDILIFSMRGRMQFRKLTILQIVSPILWALYIAFLYYTNQFRAWRVLFGMAVYGFPFFISSLPFRISFDIKIYKKLLQYGLPLILAGFLSSLIFQLDRWFIMFLKIPRDMGIYTMATSLAGIFYIFPSALAHIAHPQMVKNEDNHDVYATYHINIILLFAPLVAFLIKEFSYFGIKNYLSEYMDSLPIINILILSMLFAGVVNILYGIWISKSEWKKLILFQFIPISINFLLNYYFLYILRKSIIFAAYTTLISMFIYMIVIIFSIKYRIRIVRLASAILLVIGMNFVPIIIWIILTGIYIWMLS